MTNRRNFYRILHVQEDAPQAIIRTSYRTLMQSMKMHPDLGGHHADASLINEAYATLMDPDRRADYDRQLPTSVEIHRNEPDLSGEPPTFDQPPSADISGHPIENDPDSCPLCRTPHQHGETIPPLARCARCSSPLYPAVKYRFDDGRREIGRLPRMLNVACTVFDNLATEELRTVADDISPNGLRLRTEHAIPAGVRMKIDCELLFAVGVVRHCRHTSGDPGRMWRVGVEFLTLQLFQNRGAFVSESA